jgi:Protein of unknown function (DUF3761)
MLSAGAVSVAAAVAAPPQGATARCRDGSYSYSQHHSGTCSHHGGVAVWLDGVVINTTSRADPGTTILLAKRTRTSGCRLAANPDRRCSPGAYYSRLTRSVICSSTFRTSNYRNVPISEKHADEHEYGLAQRSYGTTLEIDHIVSLELGGSNDVANLFPEEASPSPGYHVKDKLENKVHDLVCSGHMSLRSAQHQIAADWQVLYKKVFGSPPTG